MSNVDQITEHERYILLGVARRIVRNEHDAEDIVQDAFLLIIKGSSFRGESNLFSYMYSVVKYASIQLMRNKKDHIHIDDPLRVDSLRELFRNPHQEQDLLNKEREIIVRKFSNRLPKSSGDVIREILDGVDHVSTETRFRNGRFRGIRVLNSRLGKENICRV